MSTATIAEPIVPNSANGQALSVVEYVKSLSPEEKSHVFECLLHELIDMNEGWGVIPLKAIKGEWLGNLVTTKAPADEDDRCYAQLPAETRHAMMKRHIDFDWDNVLSEEEVNAIFNEGYATLGAKTRQTIVQPYLDLEMPPELLKQWRKPIQVTSTPTPLLRSTNSLPVSSQRPHRNPSDENVPSATPKQSFAFVMELILNPDIRREPPKPDPRTGAAEIT